MTLRECLAELDIPDRRESAARALSELVHAFGKRLQCSKQDREDVVQMVLERLLDPARPVRDVQDAYVKRMLQNKLSSLFRERKRVATLEDPTQIADERAHLAVEHGTGGANELDAERTIAAAFDELLARAISLRDARYRVALEADARQLLELATRAVDIDELIARETEADEPKTRVRNRLLRRHTRVREALAEALELLESEHPERGQELDLMRGICRRLVRCQRSNSRPSGGSND